VSKLPEEFLNYDTAYNDGENKGGHYKLDFKEGLVITIFCASFPGEPEEAETLFTTVRRWTPEKEAYYKPLIGKEIRLVDA